MVYNSTFIAILEKGVQLWKKNPFQICPSHSLLRSNALNETFSLKCIKCYWLQNVKCIKHSPIIVDRDDIWNHIPVLHHVLWFHVWISALHRFVYSKKTNLFFQTSPSMTSKTCKLRNIHTRKQNG